MSLRKLWNMLFNKEQQPFIITEKEVPFHIKEVAKLYPILHTLAGNRAVGDIKFFDFTTHENTLRVGQAFIVHEKKDVQAIWVHLGNDFFKNVATA